MTSADEAVLLHEKALMIQRLRFSVSSSESLNKAKMLTAMQDWRIELRKKRGLECGLEESTAGGMSLQPH